MAVDNYGPLIGDPTTGANISVAAFGDPVRLAIIDLDARIQGVNIGLGNTVRKLSDETVTNSTTLHVDSELVLPVLAGQVYALDGFIAYTAPVANDITIGWAFTVVGGGSPGTCLWTPDGLSTTATGVADASATGNYAQYTNASPPQLAGAAGAHCAAKPKGIVFGGTQDGTIAFRFAQFVAGAATSSVVFTGSWFSLTPIG